MKKSKKKIIILGLLICGLAGYYFMPFRFVEYTPTTFAPTDRNFLYFYVFPGWSKDKEFMDAFQNLLEEYGVRYKRNDSGLIFIERRLAKDLELLCNYTDKTFIYLDDDKGASLWKQPRVTVNEKGRRIKIKRRRKPWF
jgi:hypothetical protein